MTQSKDRGEDEDVNTDVNVSEKVAVNTSRLQMNWQKI